MIQVDTARQSLLDIAIQALTIMNNLRLRRDREKLSDDVYHALGDIRSDLAKIAEHVTVPEEFPDLDSLMEKS